MKYTLRAHRGLRTFDNFFRLFTTMNLHDVFYLLNGGISARCVEPTLTALSDISRHLAPKPIDDNCIIRSCWPRFTERKIFGAENWDFEIILCTCRYEFVLKCGLLESRTHSNLPRVSYSRMHRSMSIVKKALLNQSMRLRIHEKIFNMPVWIIIDQWNSTSAVEIYGRDREMSSSYGDNTAFIGEKAKAISHSLAYLSPRLRRCPDRMVNRKEIHLVAFVRLLARCHRVHTINSAIFEVTDL